MKCNHEEGYSGEIHYGKVIEVTTERVKVEWKEYCQECHKLMDKGTHIYHRKD